MRYIEILRKSLRQYECEEVIDLYFFRPLASLFVRAIYRTQIKPDQITISSFFICIISAILYSYPARLTYVTASILYLLYCILDCADGQLARLKGSGTDTGHILDGMIDWVGNFLIYLGLTIGLFSVKVFYPVPFFPELTLHGSIWAIAAALTVGSHAMIFDYYKNNYICRSAGLSSWFDMEVKRYNVYINNAEKSNVKFLIKSMIRIYKIYCSILIIIAIRIFKEDRYSINCNSRSSLKRYLRENRKIIHLWGFIGSSTHIFLLAMFAILEELKIFFWVTVIVSNLYFIILIIYQRKINGRLRDLHTPTEILN